MTSSYQDELRDELAVNMRTMLQEKHVVHHHHVVFHHKLMIRREPADHGVQDTSPSALFLCMVTIDNGVGVANSWRQHQCGGNQRWV